MKKTVQAGFTLMEMLVVVVIIGILIAITAPYIFGSSDGARATAMMRTAEGAQKTLQLLNQACGTTTEATGNTLPDTGKTLSDVIFGGVQNVAPAFKACYAKSKVSPMTEIGVPSGTAGVYQVQGYNVSFAGGGTSPLQVIFANSPDSVTLELAGRFTPSLTELAASDTTSPVVQYSTATGKLRTVTILKQ